MKARLSTTTDYSGLRALKRDFEIVASKTIQEGFLEGHHGPSGMTYAQLALMLEEGTRTSSGAVHIPARPAFKHAYFSLQSSSVFKEYGQLQFTLFCQGKISAGQFLDNLGTFLRDWHKDIMYTWVTSGTTAMNNAPLTIDLKGFNMPFVHTGELTNNVKYTVV